MDENEIATSSSKLVGQKSDGTSTPGPGPALPPTMAVPSTSSAREADFEFQLVELAERFRDQLSSEPLISRYAHHISHMASEGFLSQELAYLVNNEGNNLGLSGWHADLERKRVDVTLVNQTTGKEIYLELKQVPPDWWKSNWKEVYKDLGAPLSGGPSTTKPIADYAVCFIIYRVDWPSHYKKSTIELYEQYLANVPQSPGVFVPFKNDQQLRPLRVLSKSLKFRASWARPTGEIVGDVWTRIIWLKLADDH